MHPPCPKYTTDVNLFNMEPKESAVTKDHTVSLGEKKNNCKEMCLIGIAGKRASQLVTLARWRMDAVLVRCNAVSKTCSKVEPVGFPQQLFTRGVDPFFFWHVEKLQVKNPLRTTCHVFFQAVSWKSRYELTCKLSIDCNSHYVAKHPSVVALLLSKVTHEEARHQCKKPKRARMKWSRKFCVAQAIQTLCSHEERHVV